MEMHFATVWESIAETMPDEPAVTHGDTTRTWREYDDRAARVAGALTAAGLGPDSKVSLYLYNCNEYMEAQYGTFKMRGVSINVNYRYLDDELRYLLDNSDSEALFFHSSLGDRVARVVDRLPDLKIVVEVDDGVGAGLVPGAVRYEELMASSEPMPRIERNPDDIYMLYTGGTTGMPKGVMYDMGGMTGALAIGGYPILGLEPPQTADDIAPAVAGLNAQGQRRVTIPCAPLMHGTGLWAGCFITHLMGGHVVTLTNRSLDAHEVLAAIERHGATSLIIVGDSFAKPLIRAIDEGKPDGSTYDTSTIVTITSSGVMWTTEVKEALLDRIGQAMLVDAMASTEGSMGTQITMRGVATETAKFAQNPTTKVFTDDDREVTPGSDEVGMVAAGGNVPIGYYKDPEKSARTFREIDGVRYSFPGDFAQVAADGTLILLGRGSQVINTGGEKVFPEEVEEAVKRVEGVLDCLVVGIDDEKYGNAVTAVVGLHDGATVAEADIITSVKRDLAGYKAPKSVVFIDVVPRAPNGKADYRTARRHAEDALANSV
ncbi:MAG: acyl-CoA synthetase [Actinomycetota bacterium]